MGNPPKIITEDQYRFLELEYGTLRSEIESSKDRAFKIVAGEAVLIPIAQFLFEWKGLGNEKEGGIVYLFIPTLVLILVYRFLYENNCIYRAGCYIRSNIEPFYDEPQISHKYEAWEGWLETEEKAFRVNPLISLLLIGSMIKEAIKNLIICHDSGLISLSLIGSKIINCYKALIGHIRSEHPIIEKPHRKVDKYLKTSFYLISAFYYIATVSFAWFFMLSNNMFDDFLRITILILYIILGLIMFFKVLDVWVGTSSRPPSSSAK